MSVSALDIIHNMSFAGWGIALSSFLLTLLSGVIFWQDVTKRSNKFFFYFGIVVGLWGLSYAFFDGALGTPRINEAVAVLYLVAGLVPLSVFLYLYVFSTEKSPFSFWKFVGLLVPYLLISATLTVSDFIVGYESAFGGTPGHMIFGKGYPLYVLYVSGFLAAGMNILIKHYRESAGIFKVALRNFLIALSAACIVVFFTTLIFPIFGGSSNLFWLGHFAVVLLGFATAYILSIYNFWNIKIIATEFFISIIAVVLIVELFLAASVIDLLIKAGITLLIIFSSSFLVGSVKREIQSKDKITRLVHDLEVMGQQLKILDKKKSEFLSIASHHLRDPLTAIKGYASMLMEGSFGELSLPVSEAIDKIFESSKRLITMISDFMDISRIESGDMKYTFGDVDMKKLVLGLADEMKLNAEKAHIGLNITVDDPTGEESFVTVGDSGKLRQVASNLIDNSIKYTPRGEVSVLLSKSPDKKKIVFSVSDTGIGMNATTLEKIFKKFSRAEGVSKVYTEGTGLGLYVAKEIVKKHEGNIWAESKGEGAGSSFYVELEAKK